MRTAGLLRSRINAAGVGPGLRESEPRPAMPMGETVASLPTVQDALFAARRALAVARAHAQGSRSFEGESYPIAAILAQLERRLEALEPGRGVSPEGWFEELPATEAQVTLLLAMLERARLQRILLGQREGFGAILLKRLGGGAAWMAGGA